MNIATHFDFICNGNTGDLRKRLTGRHRQIGSRNDDLFGSSCWLCLWKLLGCKNCGMIGNL